MTGPPIAPAHLLADGNWLRLTGIAHLHDWGGDALYRVAAASIPGYMPR
jgi:hypothetical protein